MWIPHYNYDSVNELSDKNNVSNNPSNNPPNTNNDNITIDHVLQEIINSEGATINGKFATNEQYKSVPYYSNNRKLKIETIDDTHYKWSS